ncbi:MAG TPA: hypothetical protein PKH93_04775 [Chitinophagales bacterium]|nr:hypothetical protein [Chitinophagales bacterium]
MKKQQLIFALLGAIFLAIVTQNQAVTYPDGPPNNRCGLYGTQPTCTACHSAPATNNATCSISVSGNPTSYTLGQTYTITVTATGGLAYGFEAACVRNNNNQSAGTLVAATGTELSNGTVSGNSIAFIKQNAASASGVWTFSWTAPATDVGAVTFYLATLSANTAGGSGSDSGDRTKTATLTLNAPTSCAALTVSIGGNTSFCQGGSTSLVASGGSTYLWSNGGGGANNTVAQAGVYTVTATDANACTGTAQVTVTVNSLPNASISGANGVCDGSSTSLMASGGGTYNWSNGASSSTTTVSQAGTYTVTVTNSNGCSTTAQKSLTTFALPLANITGNTAFCQGGNTTLTASGGTSYLWSNAANAAAINITAAGTYTVTVTNSNNCQASSTATITVTPLPTPNISTISTTSCAGSTATYTVSNPGSTGTSYNWIVTGGTILSGQGTTSITVQWATAGSGTVSIQQTTP